MLLSSALVALFLSMEADIPSLSTSTVALAWLAAASLATAVNSMAGSFRLGRVVGTEADQWAKESEVVAVTPFTLTSVTAMLSDAVPVTVTFWLLPNAPGMTESVVGVVMLMVGGFASNFSVDVFMSSTLPALSVEKYLNVYVPSILIEIGPV